MPILLDLIQKYWITTALLIILITLFRQNFFINQFPNSLTDKQNIISQNIQANQALDKQNTIKQTELKVETDSNMEVLESQARHRFRLIKKGEIYHQITLQNP